jgi:hypothetical protein
MNLRSDEFNFRKEMYSIAESALWNLGQKAMALIIKTDTFYTVKKKHPTTSGIAHGFQ